MRARDGPQWVDELAHRLGPKVVTTTETHAFVMDRGAGEVLRSMPFGAHAPYSWRLRDGRIAAPTTSSERTRVLDPLEGTSMVRPGVDRGCRLTCGGPVVTSRRGAGDGVGLVGVLRLRDSAVPGVDSAGPERVDGAPPRAVSSSGRERGGRCAGTEMLRGYR